MRAHSITLRLLVIFDSLFQELADCQTDLAARVSTPAYLLTNSHRATDTPAKDALDLYCKAVALNREELAKAACKGIIKTKFSELPEDVLKTLPSSAIIALVSWERKTTEIGSGWITSH